ncbi:pyridoxal-phosphate dependent enzyme [Streptomyces sp. NPDC097619]|uniref:pyridoxal-phosphate dependent enzyme n=1 Tax=Streptomyces sp. NPDC097619 TaxID=3157228 RepID=UPI0033169F4D
MGSAAAADSPPPRAPRWYARPAAREWTCAPVDPAARAFHRGLPGYAPTPLVELPSLAAEFDLGRVFVKDESARLGLPAFKALGAFWAVHRILDGRPGPGPTLITATDGNHGRAVARAARLAGRPARIFTPDGVHPAAVAAIAAEGAEVVPVPGSYDEAVLRAAREAELPDTALVQDTSWPGYEEVPGRIVEGYATLCAEIDEQLAVAGAGTPALVAVPVGVGSLAQAVVTHYRGTHTARPTTHRPAHPAGGGAAPTALLAVEPEAAPCLLESLLHGAPVTVDTGRTVMAGLNCGTVSALAWPYLSAGIDAAVSVTDAAATRAAADLATLGLPAGPCGAAALAGLRTALTGPGASDRRARLGLGADAVVVLLSTEGPEANPHGERAESAGHAEHAEGTENVERARRAD